MSLRGRHYRSMPLSCRWRRLARYDSHILERGRHAAMKGRMGERRDCAVEPLLQHDDELLSTSGSYSLVTRERYSPRRRRSAARGRAFMASRSLTIYGYYQPQGSPGDRPIYFLRQRPVILMPTRADDTMGLAATDYQGTISRARRNGRQVEMAMFIYKMLQCEIFDELGLACRRHFAFCS